MSLNEKQTGPLDLRRSLVESFWAERDEKAGAVLAMMERYETWRMDDHKLVADAMIGLGLAFERADKTVVVLAMNEIIKLAAYLSASRALRLMEWLDERCPGAVDEALKRQTLEEPGSGVPILAGRLHTLDSLRVLNRVFAPARLKAVRECLACGVQNNQR